MKGAHGRQNAAVGIMGEVASAFFSNETGELTAHVADVDIVSGL